MITNNNSYLNDSIANTKTTGTAISDILDTVVAVSNINGKSTKIIGGKRL